MADIVAVRSSFGLTVSEAKTETTCPMTKRMDRVTFVTEAAGQVYKQTAMFVYLGATVCENADLSIEINRRVLLANLRFRRYGLPLYDQPTAPLRLKVRMLKAEVMETMLYGCVTWSPRRGPSRYTAQNSPPIAPPLHRMEEETWRRLPRAVLRRRTRQDWL